MHVARQPAVARTARDVKREAGMSSPLLLRDMMVTQVRTVNEDDSVSLADWDMVVGEVRHLVVIDRERRVVGILSDRDVLRGFAKYGAVAVPVAQVMTRDVHTAPATRTAVDAAVHILQSRQSALPIVDDRRVLLGIVTSTDFVELAHRALAGLDVHQPHARA